MDKTTVDNLVFSQPNFICTNMWAPQDGTPAPVKTSTPTAAAWEKPFSKERCLCPQNRWETLNVKQMQEALMLWQQTAAASTQTQERWENMEDSYKTESF